MIVTAVAPGKQAMDQDAFGGNPFASALIEVLRRDDLALPAGLAELKAATQDLSAQFQTPQLPVAKETDWSLAKPERGERRVALVITMGEYRIASRLDPLPGAAFDAIRVSRALRLAGFQTEMLVAADLAEYRAALSAFRGRAAEADSALIYTTAHGIETGGAIHLLSTDYPRPQGKKALASHAIVLDEVAASATAKRRNLIFYAGCRDDPLQ